ncbi:peptidase inhibitor family I36 protein [Nocardiopsis sp. MG754419]|uniref:peptidase inhibitor family I36 protein n=1 Tax=Nocardiopsis sp. MG754419 TaxID=2259865 RepID=UPI001BAA7074|nr:peptidase inhibitor family I36 protein [Nocardiopsis sp. MG754419]
MRKILIALMSAGAGVALTLALGVPAQAQEAAPTEVAGVTAELDGQVFDLSQGWGDAETCLEEPDGAPTDFRCYAGEDSHLETQSLDDCPSDHVCLWESAQFGGEMVGFTSSGNHDLGNIGWRDRASSFYNNRSTTVTFVDFRSGIIADRWIRYEAGNIVADLSSIPYPDGGSWDNKIDRVTLP